MAMCNAAWHDEQGEQHSCTKRSHLHRRAHLCGCSAHIPNCADEEPQPSDGPDYHADHSQWAARQRRSLNHKKDGR